ncbi:MAG TPA: DUF2834 domain-containing protein [Amycolatopsis sp.]|uniref:DUF2834 domain-containing protein n=1 Tax=Amycolatopsis sp. TaxID=37632 RepID=UPI002B45FFF6|nr:DUF2834 domain-containing protein [Amycolatopsis sp.]HKS45781.1 DUF2834 domain-containing protein [Amycolatopsis sp.]
MPRFRETQGRDRTLCLCYGLFAIGDLVIVCAIAIRYVVEHSSLGVLGVIGHFFRDALTNPAAWFVYTDLTLVWIVLAVYMIVEARRFGIRFVWLYVIAAPLSALSVSFPAFMFVRQLKIATEATRVARSRAELPAE